MSDNRYLSLVYWALTISIGISFIIALVTEAKSLPYNGGVPRLVGLVLIGVLALVWMWLSDLGKEALRWMA